MKRFAKALVFFIFAIATVSGYAANICAAAGGALENSIIPPEGQLFMPDSLATRGTVAVALYSMSTNGAIQSSNTDNAQNSALTQTAIQGFSDVPKDSPYYSPVNFCASKGYVSGYPDGTFKPVGQISRAEICVVLSRFLALNAKSQVTMPTDITAGHWASDAIATIVSNGIMSGYEDKTFRPDKKLTRAELATIIVNAKHLTPPDNIVGFSDVPKTHWAYKSVACVSAPSASASVPSASAPTPSASASAPSASAIAPSTSTSAPSASATPGTEPSQFEVSVAKKINEHRVEAGVNEVWLDPYLCEIARIKAQDMIDNNYFDHRSPKWGYPDEMLRGFGVTFLYQGENIARGAVIPSEVVADWIYSPPHYENLTSKYYNKTGVGCAKSKDGVLYWVQIFCD